MIKTVDQRLSQLEEADENVKGQMLLDHRGLVIANQGQLQDNLAGAIQALAKSSEKLLRFGCTRKQSEDVKPEEDAAHEGEGEESEGTPAIAEPTGKLTLVAGFNDHELKVVKSDKLTLAVRL